MATHALLCGSGVAAIDRFPARRVRIARIIIWASAAPARTTLAKPLMQVRCVRASCSTKILKKGRASYRSRLRTVDVVGQAAAVVVEVARPTSPRCPRAPSTGAAAAAWCDRAGDVSTLRAQRYQCRRGRSVESAPARTSRVDAGAGRRT